MFEKLVVVTRRTRLEELIARFNTRGQARFVLEHAGATSRTTSRARHAITGRSTDCGGSSTWAFRVSARSGAGPDLSLRAGDLIVTWGRTAWSPTPPIRRRAAAPRRQPRPERFDGVLLPFSPGRGTGRRGRHPRGQPIRAVTLAEAKLGRRPAAARLQRPVHRRAHPRLRALPDPRGEKGGAQSSSGVLVSTGAGSTGWISSVFNMAAG